MINLYGDGPGRPRAEDVITKRNEIQQQLYEIFALDRFAKDLAP